MKIKKIFIHGWSFSSQIWKDFFDIPDSQFIDLPFHGQNKDYTDQNIMENFAEDIYKQIQKSQEEVVLIGWSLGASISVLTALKKPSNLKKLVLIGFSPKFKDKNLGHNPVFVKAFMVALKVDFSDTIYNFRKTAAGDTFRDIPLPEKEGSIKLLREFIELDLTQKLKDISVPAYLIHGKKDKIINYQGSVFASQQIKNSQLYLTNSNHAPFLEKNTQDLIKNIIS